MRRAHSSFFRTTTKSDVVGALFLFVLFIVFLVRHGLEISVGRGLAGLDHAKLVCVSQFSLRAPKGI
jgi:hypothetical protein